MSYVMKPLGYRPSHGWTWLCSCGTAAQSHDRIRAAILAIDHGRVCNTRFAGSINKEYNYGDSTQSAVSTDTGGLRRSA